MQKTQFWMRVLPVLVVVAALFSGSAAAHVNAVLVASAPFPAGLLTDPGACTRTGTILSCDLWAKTGTLSLPGGNVPIWGYATSASAAAQVPGPTIIANQGDTLTITLHNSLNTKTALTIPTLNDGQAPDAAGVAASSSTTYSFTLGTSGTFLYEAGVMGDGQRQTLLGLFGGLIIRSASPATAYGSAFDDEALLILSEVDPAFNASADPMSYDLRGFKPRYRLINGKAYPTTDTINTARNHKMLLRYINAGAADHSISLLGLSKQTILAEDGKGYAYPYSVVAQTITAGQSLDTLVTIPSSAVANTKYAVYEANNTLYNSNAAGLGGMLSFLNVVDGSGADTTGPVTSNGVIGTGYSVTATVSDGSTGGNNVTAAEYFVDLLGANGSGAAMSGTFGAPSVAVSATIPPATISGLSTGVHTVYIHGQDVRGNWGAVIAVQFTVDKTGPATTGLTASPSNSNGTVAVTLSGTEDDAATGGSNSTGAEYFLDPAGGTVPTSAYGTGVALTAPTPGVTIPVTGTIPANVMGGLSEGTHTAYVHGKDDKGNWGAFTPVAVVVDKTKPVVSAVLADPSPQYGTTAYVTYTTDIKLSATATDSASNIVAVESFIDPVGTPAPGTGLVFIANDGSLNSTSEGVYAKLPLATVRTLSEGSHVIAVRAQDAAGNWGIFTYGTLVIDKTGPAISNVLANPNPTNGASTTLLTATITDALSNVTVAEWYADTDPGVGRATAFTIAGNTLSVNVSATINVNSLSVGTHRLYVRAKDVAGNWGASSIAYNLVVDAPNLIFNDSFGSGNFAAWNGTTGTGVSVTAAASLSGTPAFGMQATVNNVATNYVTTTTNLNNQALTYRARFSFNPNSATSGATQLTILQGRNAANAALFSIQYKRTSTTYQVRIQATGIAAPSGWVNINNATNNTIEIAWQAGTTGSMSLIVNGVAATPISGNTGTAGVRSVLLGEVVGAATTSGVMYFDNFQSAHNTIVP